MAGQSKGQTVGYVRVSSTDQNPARQLAAIGEVDRVFEDRVSGKERTARRGLAELQQYVRAGDLVLVASMDRLARSLIDLMQIVGELTEQGVTIRFLKEGLSFSADEANAMARLQLQIMGAFAEFERTLIRERQAEGIAAARDRGVYERPMKLTPKEVAAAARRIADKVPVATVARDLGIGRSTLYRYLAEHGERQQARLEGLAATGPADVSLDPDPGDVEPADHEPTTSSTGGTP